MYFTSLLEISVIAGESMEIKSPVRTRTPCYYLDIEMNSNSKFTQNIPPTWTTFIYTLEGNIEIESRIIKAHHTIVFSKEGDCIAFQNSSDSMARFILIAGEPINEPIGKNNKMYHEISLLIKIFNSKFDDYIIT